MRIRHKTPLPTPIARRSCPTDRPRIGDPVLPRTPTTPADPSSASHACELLQTIVLIGARSRRKPTTLHPVEPSLTL